jgi:competence protein ComEC
VAVPRDEDRRQLRRIARDRGMAWRTILAGARIEIGDVTIDALHPPAPDWERQRVRNDDSIVLRVQYGRVELLLTGDAGLEFERRLPPALGGSAIRILKAGHHGSRTSTTAALIEALRPQIVLISAGRGNLFGHPAPEVLGRIVASGAEVLRTDRDGAISLETDGATVQIVSALGRRWSIVSAAPGAPGGRP